MKMAKTSKSKLIRQFEDLLWANTLKNWMLKSIYIQGTLFVSIFIETSNEEQSQTIRRSFDMGIIRNRSKDLWGLAVDCVDEMKTEVKN